MNLPLWKVAQDNQWNSSEILGLTGLDRKLPIQMNIVYIRLGIRYAFSPETKNRHIVPGNKPFVKVPMSEYTSDFNINLVLAHMLYHVLKNTDCTSNDCTRADQFAENFLMPWYLVDLHMMQKKTVKQVASLFQIPLDIFMRRINSGMHHRSEL